MRCGGTQTRHQVQAFQRYQYLVTWVLYLWVKPPPAHLHIHSAAALFIRTNQKMTVDHGDYSAARRRRHRPNSGSSIDNGAASDSDGLVVSNHNHANNKTKKRKRRNDDESPFYMLVLQVGASLFIFCLLIYFALRSTIWKHQATNPEDDDGSRGSGEEEALPMIATLAPIPPTAPPLPVWELGIASKYDAFGIAERYENKLSNSSNEISENLKESLLSFWRVAKELRDEFVNYYGGENAARALLERGLITFGINTLKNATEEAQTNSLPSDLVHTACRIRNAKREDRPFAFAFGGYSVTAGRGNYFTQSFPFVMRNRLAMPFSMLGIELIVKNAAIGGCSAFPYGWCMSNFWGLEADVVSWDYAMNEAGGIPQGMEAYLRHAVMLRRSPKMIVKDTHLAGPRRDVLQKYMELGIVKDPVVILSDPAAQPFLQRKEEYRPPGFQEWRKFGAPLGAPGQAYHHPAVKEHEMMGWMLAMHFLSALELVAADVMSPLPLNCEPVIPSRVLPPPVTFQVNENTTLPWESLLFGVPTSSDIAMHWTMNSVQCRTTFEPILDGKLRSIVVSGSVAEDLNILLPKSEMYYNKGWVYDMSKGEKEAKRKLDRFGGLGFLDSKKAYYGLYSSEPLRLLLPVAGNRTDSSGNVMEAQNGDVAQDWFRHIVICQVNEKRDVGSCNIEKDLFLRVGGVNVTDARLIDSAGVLYLGQKICVHVKVPVDAKLTTKAGLQPPSRKKHSKNEESSSNHQVGLGVEIAVSNHHIMSRDFACSISHVVWEETGSVAASLTVQATVNQESATS